MIIFRVQIGGWAFNRAWAFIRDFTITEFIHAFAKYHFYFRICKSRFSHDVAQVYLVRFFVLFWYIDFTVQV